MNASTLPRSSMLATDEVGDLAALFEPWCNIALLRRPMGAELEKAALNLAQATWSEIRVTLHHDGEAFDLTPVEEALAPLAGEGAITLARDLAWSSELLMDLTGAESVGVRLTRLVRPACPSFHYDRVGLRLVTTYLGPGTELRPHRTPKDTATSPGGLTDEVHTTQEGDLVWLKGTVWPGNEERGAVHRSPMTEGGTVRVMASLDPL